MNKKTNGQATKAKKTYQHKKGGQKVKVKIHVPADQFNTLLSEQKTIKIVFNNFNFCPFQLVI